MFACRVVTVTPPAEPVSTTGLKMWRPDDPVSRSTGTGLDGHATSTIGRAPPRVPWPPCTVTGMICGAATAARRRRRAGDQSSRRGCDEKSGDREAEAVHRGEVLPTV